MQAKISTIFCEIRGAVNSITIGVNDNIDMYVGKFSFR